MEKLKFIKQNHDLSFSIDLIPYKYLAATIAEYLNDIKEIDSIVSEEGNILNLCKTLKSQINSKIDYLKKKLDNIPNPKYLEESDEEFVDKFM